VKNLYERWSATFIADDAIRRLADWVRPHLGL
jgi:hypothetical protein